MKAYFLLLQCCQLLAHGSQNWDIDLKFKMAGRIETISICVKFGYDPISSLDVSFIGGVPLNYWNKNVTGTGNNNFSYFFLGRVVEMTIITIAEHEIWPSIVKYLATLSMISTTWHGSRLKDSRTIKWYLKTKLYHIRYKNNIDLESPLYT